MTRVLAGLTLGALLAAVLALVVVPSERATATPSVPAAAPCDWQHELDSTLAELGENPAQWFRVRGDTMAGTSGITYMDTMRVLVHADAPCRIVGDIVRHEHMHLQQARAYGGWGAHHRFGDRLEIIADCGSWLLGSVTFTPYRDKYGCSEQDMHDAFALIDIDAHDRR